jgi:hypothetical protein
VGFVIVVVKPLLATLLAGPGPSIVAAHGRGDHDEVARQAGSAGAAGVASLIAADDRPAAVAGIAAAPHVPDPWELFDELEARAAGWDRSLAAPAAHAAAVIVRGLDGDVAIQMELPDDVLADVEAGWRALAMRADRWADVRVHALEVAARVAAARIATADAAPGPGYDLIALLADDDPEVRRAAAELTPLPAPEAWRAPLAAAIAGDVEPAVAVAAAQALCAEIGPAPPGTAGDAQIAAVVAALGDDAAARLRTIFKGAIPAVPPGALVDAARCLAARGGKDDRAAVRALASRAGRVKSWIARLERHKGRS